MSVAQGLLTHLAHILPQATCGAHGGGGYSCTYRVINLVERFYLDSPFSSLGFGVRVSARVPRRGSGFTFEQKYGLQNFGFFAGLIFVFGLGKSDV